MRNIFGQLSIFVVGFVAIAFFIVAPKAVIAQTEQSVLVDNWGLSDRDWRELDGMDLVQKAGCKLVEASCNDLFNELLTAAENHDAKAMVLVGLIFSRIGNIDAATNWFRKAAEAGNSLGMVFLGGNLITWGDVENNKSEAIQWFRKAAEAGDSRGMVFLALTLASGNGNEKDEVEEAKRWLRMAAERGGISGTIAVDDLRDNYGINCVPNVVGYTCPEQ